MSILRKIKNAITPEPEYIIHPEKAPEYKPMTTQIPNDYTVEYVNDYSEDGRLIGFHPEPPLSSIINANDLDRLRWLAALVNGKHPELRISIREGVSYTNGVRVPDQFAISYRNAGMSGQSFDNAWSMIRGMEAGAEVIKNHYKDQINE